MSLENKVDNEAFKEAIGDWVIVHNREYGQKEVNVGKLSSIDTNVIFLDVFHGSFEKGCLASSLTLPYNSIEKIYNKECEVIYQNSKFEGK